MCDNCEEAVKKWATQMATFVEGIRLEPTSEWQLSEPLFVGGLTGIYVVQSPFVNQSMWAIDIAISGYATPAGSSTIIVSPERPTTHADFTGVQQPSFSGFSAYPGIFITVPYGTTSPVSSQWYPILNSEGALYVSVQTGTTNIAGINVQFRQKRKINGART